MDSKEERANHINKLHKTVILICLIYFVRQISNWFIDYDHRHILYSKVLCMKYLSITVQLA